MTSKLGITHKLARLVPAIRRLHDSALEANIRLDQYAQENERLRSFMESESEKIRDLNVSRNTLNSQIAELKLKENELVTQRELNSSLKGRIKKLEDSTARLQDLCRLQDNFSTNYASLQDDYNSQQVLHAKTVEDLKTKLEEELELKSELFTETESLQSIIQENAMELESFKKDLEHAEQRRQEQINRSLELEGVIQEKSDELDSLNQDLEHVEQRRQEQINRSFELEAMVQEGTHQIDTLTVNIQNIETRRQEQIERSLFLEKEIQSLTSELSTKEIQLNELKVNLNDSQHYATIRSEEALARILGKLSQIDHKGSKIPLTTGSAPLSNYSPHELVLGKYFDLLIGTLTGTLTEDEPISPWSEGGYDPEVRSLGRDWPATACSMIGTVRMTSLQRLVCDVIENDVEGDAIETGVWRGGACILMKSIFDLYGCADRKVWVADSFQGLPKPNSEEFENDPEDDPHHTFEPLRVSQEQVADNFRKFGALDDNVKFLKGWFKDTLHKAPIKKLAILRLDGDMEESTLQALNALYNKVSKGGYVIIDDYGLGPCRKAVDAFRLEHGIDNPIFEVDAACVYWQV